MLAGVSYQHTASSCSRGRGHGILVSTHNYLLRNPFENFYNCTVRTAHDNRRTFVNETFGAQRRVVVADQLAQRLLATSPRFVAGYRNRPHAIASVCFPAPA